MPGRSEEGPRRYWKYNLWVKNGRIVPFHCLLVISKDLCLRSQYEKCISNIWRSEKFTLNIVIQWCGQYFMELIYFFPTMLPSSPPPQTRAAVSRNISQLPSRALTSYHHLFRFVLQWSSSGSGVYNIKQVCLTLGWSSVVFALWMLIEKNL